MPQYAKKFGRLVRARRNKMGCSLRDLATRVKMPHTTLYQIERGITDPTLSVVHRLAQAFHEPVTSLLLELERAPKAPANV